MRTARATPLCFPDRGTHGLLQLHRGLLQIPPGGTPPWGIARPFATNRRCKQTDSPPPPEPSTKTGQLQAPSMAVDITALYCCLDDFCKVFGDWEAHRLIPSQTIRQRTGKLSRSEMLFIMVLFHLSPFKHFKVFYHYGIGQQHRACFRELPHYDRFVGLMPRLFAPLMVLLHSLGGAQTGIYFADSTKLAVCHNRRIHRHKVFDGLAARGKTSMGWFFGLKLHFVINHKGQIMALKITPGNTADSTVLDEITRHL